LVAAKCIRSAKIRKEWAIKQAMSQAADGGDIDDMIREIDEAEMSEGDKEEALADFRQEISILKSLRHPNIVLLLAYSTTADLQVMISELMKCSLLDVFKAHIVNGTKMKDKDQIVYATQLAQGMLYLHTCKPPIIHRDLKPGNLLIDHSGILKVADFGLSKVRPDPQKTEKDSFMMTGETGSYRFMAPEVFRHQQYTETVDVYSYGMILFYLLDGKPPWPYDNGLIAVRKAADEGERPTLPRSWESSLQRLLQDCWDENPASRPSFKQVLQSLNEYSRKWSYDSRCLMVCTLHSPS
jgi:serine/threonine protein kinase